MQDLEEFLNTELAKLPEFQKDKSAQGRQPRQDKAPVSPDANGCIYEVCGLCGVTLDCLSAYSDAEHLAENIQHTWSFYQIWQINVESGQRVLLSQKEIRRQPNPLGLVAHNAALLQSHKGSSNT